MRTWVAAIVVVGMVSGCYFPRQEEFVCTDDASCGAGGRCEPGFNLCSFANPSCPSGRAFGELAGPNSGQCVGSQLPPPDAGPPDAALFCYGTGLVRVCFSAPPSTALAIANPTTLNTDTGVSMGTSFTCATPVSGGTGYCVVLATDITIDSSLRATGSKPLILVASGAIRASATGAIDVASHRGQTPETGAGADPGACSPGTPPANGGGGAGGSCTGLGGSGGNSSVGTGGGTPGNATVAFTALRGGCRGQDGQAASAVNRGVGGHGGGAVFLVAGTLIDIQGAINAAGEGGAGGQQSTAGAGGGGAGGMIGFDGPMITATGLILANGGGGGEGSGNATPGFPGSDPSGVAAAVGGIGGSSSGGDGGAGSAGATTGPGAPGQSFAGAGGAGGGGGGGAGLIKAPASANLGTNISPLPTP